MMCFQMYLFIEQCVRVFFLLYRSREGILFAIPIYDYFSLSQPFVLELHVSVFIETYIAALQ